MTPKRLIVVAHPDDETLFFSRVMASFPESTYVICVTDGNDAGRGKVRKKEFQKALKEFGVKGCMLNFKDDFSTPLNPYEIARALSLKFRVAPNEVFTHSLYDNHWHHVSVAIACKLYAGNRRVHHFDPFAESKIAKLSKSVLEKKKKVIFGVYEKELSAIFSAHPNLENEATIYFVEYPIYE